MGTGKNKMKTYFLESLQGKYNNTAVEQNETNTVYI